MTQEAARHMEDKLVEAGLCKPASAALEVARNEFQVWKKTLPKCLSDAGGCDGDLEGLPHGENCPMFGKEFATHYDAFSAGFVSGGQASRNAAIQECAKYVRRQPHMFEHEAGCIALADAILTLKEK
jgi:hypothetical protein